MPLSQKAEKIKELLGRIDSLEQQIEDIIEDKINGIPAINFTKYTHKKKDDSPKQRFCKKCGKPGHRADGCTKKSHKHEENSGDDDLIAVELMQGQWESVKESVRHGMTSKDIAENMELPIREINLAIAAYDYDDYLSKR